MGESGNQLVGDIIKNARHGHSLSVGNLPYMIPHFWWAQTLVMCYLRANTVARQSGLGRDTKWRWKGREGQRDGTKNTLGRTRTCDLLLRRQPLYPLSYEGKV